MNLKTKILLLEVVLSTVLFGAGTYLVFPFGGWKLFFGILLLIGGNNVGRKK